MEPADDDREFMKLLGNEIDKVTQFYTSKVSLHFLMQVVFMNKFPEILAFKSIG